MMSVQMCVFMNLFEVLAPVVRLHESSDSSVEAEKLQVCLQCKFKERRVTTVPHASPQACAFRLGLYNAMHSLRTDR